MKLREYQEDISNKASKLLQREKIAYLSMEVRTGKTITALATMKKSKFKSILFVTRKKAISSILEDYKHFKNDFDLVVINYESVHKIKGKFDCIIIDEAHSLGAYPKPSLRTKRIKEIADKKPILYLSGTPTPESYSQIYHQLWVSSYSPFSSYKTFYKWAQNFVKIGQIKTNFGFRNDYSNAKKEKIEFWTNHLFISFTQEQAGFEQHKVKEVFLKKEAPLKIRKLMKELFDENIIKVDNHIIAVENALAVMQKLNQLSSGTIKVDDKGLIISDYKLKMINNDRKNNKIAIYYKYQAEFEMIKNFFGKENITTIPEAFNRSDNLIFVGQLRSAREGINLATGDILYIMTPDFSATTYFQVLGRMQHKGRKKQAILKWVIGSKLDEKIIKAIRKKQDYTLKYFRRDFEK